MTRTLIALLSAAVLLPALSSARLASAQLYVAVELNPRAGGTSAVPRALNNLGQAAGRSGEPHGVRTHAVLWSRLPQDLGSFAHPTPTQPGPADAASTLPDDGYSAALGLNQRGIAVGYSNVGSSMHGFQSDGVRFQDLPPLAGDNGSEAWHINDAGLAVGTSSGSRGRRAVVWTSGQPQSLSAPGDDSQAFAINSSGQIAGRIARHAALWTSPESAPTDLGVLPGDDTSIARALNDAGQVVGTSSSYASTHAFLWQPSAGMRDIGTLPGGDYCQANSINRSGIVVGVSGSRQGTRAVRWDESLGLQDLNALLAPASSRVFLAGASAINDQGVILAWGGFVHQSHSEKVELDHDSHAGPLHVFLLIPQQP